MGARQRLVLFTVITGSPFLTSCAPSALDYGFDGGSAAIDGSTWSGVDAFAGTYSDFPEAPIIDPSAPSNAADLFGPPDSGDASGGPCLMEPQMGALFPRNWLRVRFRMIPAWGQNLFEIRVQAEREEHDLVVYTADPIWTMPRPMWLALSQHIADQPMTVTVRGAVFDGTSLTSGPSRGTTGTITIAPAEASGSIVYWTTTGTRLRGFAVGAETVDDVLQPGEASTGCVGCHVSSPAGVYVAFSSSTSPTTGWSSHIDLRSLDGTASEPPFLTDAARTMLTRESQHAPSLSDAHWVPGDRIVLSLFSTPPALDDSEIIWTDLEATSTEEGIGWGIVERTGDSQRAGMATFDHAGTQIVYASAPYAKSGMAVRAGDLLMVPYNDGDGGTVTPVLGASDPAYNEYYPAFSTDDQLLAFNRAPTSATADSYNNSQAELFVVPAVGGTAVRLDANDPSGCWGQTSPGVTNSWPKWSPHTTHVAGKTYYWLSFSSRRTLLPVAQLYVAAVVVDETSITSYPAIYLWNQPEFENNHTPAWDDFQIDID